MESLKMGNLVMMGKDGSHTYIATHFLSVLPNLMYFKCRSHFPRELPFYFWFSQRIRLGGMSKLPARMTTCINRHVLCNQCWVPLFCMFILSQHLTMCTFYGHGNLTSLNRWDCISQLLTPRYILNLLLVKMSSWDFQTDSSLLEYFQLINLKSTYKHARVSAKYVFMSVNLIWLLMKKDKSYFDDLLCIKKIGFRLVTEFLG